MGDSSGKGEPAEKVDTGWADRIGAHADAAGALLARAGSSAAAALRTHRGSVMAAAGLALVLFALYVESGSAISLPLLIGGGLLIVHGLFGRRVSGSLELSWGEEGTRLTLDARVAPPSRRIEPAALAAGSDPGPAPELVEGSAETMEIEVARLKELLGEGGEPVSAATPPSGRGGSTPAA